MPPKERRFLLCNDKCVKECDLHLHPKHHILGEIVYSEFEGRRVTTLTLWEDSLFMSEPLPVLPRIRIENIIGNVHGIHCTLCKGVANWEIGKAAFAALELRYGKIGVK